MAEAGNTNPDGAPAGRDGSLLPEGGVKELADRLTEYLTKIELVEIPEALEQVLDDFLMQCGGIPQDLDAAEAFDQIVNNQLMVTLAFQLGRLTGRSPQLVDRFIEEEFEKWGSLNLDDETEVTAEDFDQMTEKVLPKIRRWRYYTDRE